MPVATIILFALGLLGGTDIAVYHSTAHGIRHHSDARGELVLHALRGPTYATLFIVVPNFMICGWFFWLLIAVLVFDLGLSIVDFALERKSRAFLGGLPSGEYVLHVLLGILFGAFVASVFFEGFHWSKLSSKIAFHAEAVPLWLRASLAVMACLVLVSGFFDACAVWRMRNQPKR